MAVLADRNRGAFKGSVNSAELALIFGQGARYAVLGGNDLKVTAGTGDRGIAVLGPTDRPARAWGDGVLSEWDPVNGGEIRANLNGAPVASGSRWDTLVIRRTWQPASTPTGTAELMLLTGSSTKAISAQLTTDAGATTSDQPLYLVRFDATSTVVQEIVDLRVWAGAGGGLVANDPAALGYLTGVGTTVKVGATTWVRQLDGSGAEVWARETTMASDVMTTSNGDVQKVLNSLLGSAVTGPRAYQVRAGTFIGKSSGSGGVTVSFDPAFPNACVAVVPVNGHSDAAHFTPEVNERSRSSFSYRTVRGSTVLTGIQHRVDYIAIGY